MVICMSDMGPEWLKIYSQWAAIVSVPISLIIGYFAYRGLKTQRKQIQNNKTKINEIMVKGICQISQYKSESGQIIYNITVTQNVCTKEEIKDAYMKW